MQNQSENVIIKWIRSSTHLWADTVFPRNCVACGQPDTVLCSHCRSLIIAVRQQQCVYCRKVSVSGKTCTTCRRHTPLTHTIAATQYADGPTKEALHTLKYHGRLDIIAVLSQLLIDHPDVKTSVEQNSSAIITAVPLHRRRLYWRGFNQSALIARTLANHYNLDYRDDLVRRQTFHSTQVHLHRAERARNVAKDFIANSSSLIVGRPIIIVDDVLTTGATLTACAAALKKAGARQVMAIVVAQAE